MSAEDIQTILHMSPTITSEEVARIFTMLQGFREPLDEEFFIEFGIQSDETRLKSETHTIQGPDITKPQTRTLLATRLNTVIIRKIAQPVNFYPLIHTENSFSGITFPAKDTKYGGRIEYDGTGYITVADATRLKPTDKISIIGWLYIPTNDSALHTFIRKGVTDTTYILRILATNDLQARIRTDNGGGTNYKITVTAGNFPLNTWFHFTMTWKGTPENRLRFYIDKVQQGADITTAGALLNNTQSLGIGANFDGLIKVLANTRMAWLSILHDELTQAQITDHFDGILDTNAYQEILTIPFTGNAKPQPEASFGIAKVN